MNLVLLNNIMGNICAFDNIKTVHNAISDRVFHPPDSSEEYSFMHVFSIDTPAIKITVIEYEPDGSNTSNTGKVMIYSQGNGSDLSHVREELEYYNKLFGCKVVSYDYPGYGLTKGIIKPSEENCYRALSAVVDHYLQLYEPSDIVLVGRSLGTGVVIDYVSKHLWYTPVVLISPYKSIHRVACDSCVVDVFFRHNSFNTYKKLDAVVCPVKIIHGTHDRDVDISHSMDIHRALKYPMRPSWKQGKEHNDIMIEEADMYGIF